MVFCNSTVPTVKMPPPLTTPMLSSTTVLPTIVLLVRVSVPKLKIPLPSRRALLLEIVLLVMVSVPKLEIPPPFHPALHC